MTAQRETFAAWLGHQGGRGPSDLVGWLAAAWGSFAGPDRPRLSSPVSISRYLHEHGSQDPAWQSGLDEAIETATQAYNAAQKQLSSAADGEAAHAAGAITEDDLGGAPGPVTMAGQLADAHPGPAMSLAPPELPDGISQADAQYLAHQLGQVEAQLGLIMQMLAVSSPAAASLLLEHLGDEPAPIHTLDELPDGELVTEAQKQALMVAQQNGWLNTLPGGFAQWWETADPGAGDGNG